VVLLPHARDRETEAAEKGLVSAPYAFVRVKAEEPASRQVTQRIGQAGLNLRGFSGA